MTIKKKLLIALLSTTCVAAGAAGLAACKDDTPKTDPAYTVTAVDQNGNVIEGVIFRLGYYDSKNLSTVFITDKDGKTLTATTNSKGKATFTDFTPEEGIKYSAFIAEPDGKRPYPYGYRNETYNVEFDDKLQAKYEFSYVPSSYYDNLTYAIEYKRTFDDSEYVEGDEDTMKYVEEGSETLTLDLKKDVHSYFTFQSYRELGSTGLVTGENENERVNYNQLWATKAAAGVYTVTFTTTSNTAVTMYNFNGAGYVATDKNGIPENKLTTVSGKSNLIKVELYISGYNSRSAQYFGLYASSDCSVTVTVERIGDAEEPPEIQTEKITAPTNLTEYGPQSGTLSLMAIDGSLAYVLGDDGYYHVGSKSGPLLLVNLTKAINRVGELSIMELADPEKNKDYYATGHVFPKYVDGKLTASYDYSDFLKAYAAKVNNDGVYPVDEALYAFLQLFAAKGQMITLAGEYTWLVPCQYYMPSSGMEATGNGTQTDPYILLGTTNKLGLSGTAYAQFTATVSGIYTFKSSGCDATIDGSKYSFKDENGLVHVCLGENEKLTLKVEGTGDGSITVGNATATNVEAVFGDEFSENANERPKGMTEATAIQLNSIGYTVYTVDSSVNEGVWVCVKPMIAGMIEYNFEVKGSPFAKVIYNGKTYNYGETLNLICTGGQTYSFFLTAKDGNKVVNGVYALDWQPVEKAPPMGGGEMNLGKNEVYLSADASYDGVEYTFTPDKSGKFILTVDNDSATILSIDLSEEYVIGTMGSYVIALNAGETFTFLCAGPYNESIIYNVNIEELKSDESFTDAGGTKNISINNSGEEVTFTFVSETGGNYIISVPENVTAMIYIDSASGGDRVDNTPINTAAGTYSYEFTLEAGGYITFTATVSVNGDTGSYDVTIAKK